MQSKCNDKTTCKVKLKLKRRFRNASKPCICSKSSLWKNRKLLVPRSRSQLQHPWQRRTPSKLLHPKVSHSLRRLQSPRVPQLHRDEDQVQNQWKLETTRLSKRHFRTIFDNKYKLPKTLRNVEGLEVCSMRVLDVSTNVLLISRLMSNSMSSSRCPLFNIWTSIR